MPTTVRLSAEAEERLSRLAKSTGRSKAFYLRLLIENNLDELEDVFLAERRLENLRAGQSETIKAEDVWGDLAD